MNPNKLILSSRHYDEIGAFSLADEIDGKLIKQAQSWAADPNLPSRDPEDTGGSFLTNLENAARFFGGSLQRTYGTARSNANFSMPTLNAYITCDFSNDPGNNDFKTALQQARSVIESEFNIRNRFINPAQKIAFNNFSDDKKDIYRSFTSWVQYQRQILGKFGSASQYLRKLKEAENILAKKINPKFVPKPISTPSTSPSRISPPTSGGGGSSSGGRGSGGGGRVIKPSVKPSAFNVNEKLFDLIYVVVKGYDKDTSFADMNIVYDKIKQEPMLKEAIIDKIKSSKYTPENKEKLRKKFLEKINDREYGPEPGPTPPEPTPPGPTPPSPSPSDQDVRPSPFLHDEVRKLSELDDREFMKVFESKSTILSRQIMSSYTNRVLLPEEYTYLIGAIDRMKLRFQRLLQGM